MIQKTLPVDFQQTVFRGLLTARQCFFLLTVLLAPLLFGGSGRSSVFMIQALTLTGAMLFGIQALCFGVPVDQVRMLKGPLLAFGFFALYIFFQWVGGSRVLSAPIPGTIAVFKTRDYLIQLVSYIFFFVTSLDLLASRKRIHTLSLLVALEVVFLMALGYYQQYSHPEKLTKLYGVFDLAQYDGFFSTFVNPNHYGGFLMIATFFFLAWVAHYVATNDIFRLDMQLIRTFFYGLVIVLMAFSILHAEARAALFVQISSVLVFCFVSLYFKRGMHPGLFWGAVALLASSFIFLKVVQFDLSRISPQVLIRDFWSRSGIYKDTLGIIRDFPFFGTGLGSAMYAISKYQVTGVEDYTWVHLYSHHLELITDTGFLGYLLFIAPLAWLVFRSFRAALRHPSEWRRIYATASFTAITAVFFLSIMDDYLLTPALAILFLVYLMILVLCGTKGILSLDSLKKAEPMKAELPLAAKHLCLKGGLSALLLAGFTFGVVLKDFIALDLYDRAHGDVQMLENAARLRPGDPKIWVRIGEAYYDRALTFKGSEHQRLAKRSVEAHEKALSLTPMFGYYWMLAGRAKILSRNRPEGLKYLAHAAELVPHNRDYALYLIVNALALAEETPWPEEKQRFADLAFIWVKKTSRLKRPLTEQDRGYIRNYGTDCYGEVPLVVDQRLVGLIARAKTFA